MSVVLAAAATFLLLEAWLPRGYRRISWPLLGLGLVLEHTALVGAAVSLLGLAQWWPAKRDWYPVRFGLAQYWETVAIMGTASLGALDALEAAIPREPWGQDLTAVLRQLVAGSAAPYDAFLARYPVPEASRLVRLLDRVWHDGLDPESAFEEARGMLDGLAQDRRLELLQKPLYASVLPAALLFSLLLMLAVPLGAVLAGSFLRL